MYFNATYMNAHTRKKESKQKKSIKIITCLTLRILSGAFRFIAMRLSLQRVGNVKDECIM